MTDNIQGDYKGELLMRAENGFVHFKILAVPGFPDKTSHWGGYDAMNSIEIVAGNFSVKGYLYVSTGLFYHFFQEFKECFKTLKGEAHLESNEKEFKLDVLFDGLGHARIIGQFQENPSQQNILKFDLRSDQTYLGGTLSMLEDIYDKYGGMKGIAK